jgi:hypothetical protein
MRGSSASAARGILSDDSPAEKSGNTLQILKDIESALNSPTRPDHELPGLK